jgi:hypothetical protein
VTKEELEEEGGRHAYVNVHVQQCNAETHAALLTLSDGENSDGINIIKESDKD